MPFSSGVLKHQSKPNDIFLFLDPQYEIAVKASFVFLKENLDFNSMVDQIIQGGLLQDREKEDCV